MHSNVPLHRAVLLLGNEVLLPISDSLGLQICRIRGVELLWDTMDETVQSDIG